jgi:hypothetical protein
VLTCRVQCEISAACVAPLRNVLNAARSSVTNSSGYSHAAKWPLKIDPGSSHLSLVVRVPASFLPFVHYYGEEVGGSYTPSITYPKKEVKSPDVRPNAPRPDATLISAPS